MVFCGFLLLPFWVATALGTAGTVISGIYSLRSICRLVSINRAPRAIRSLLLWSRIVPPASLAPVGTPAS
jgi:hypothetical protein